jgi:hypothetical protein
VRQARIRHPRTSLLSHRGLVAKAMADRHDFAVRHLAAPIEA